MKKETQIFQNHHFGSFSQFQGSLFFGCFPNNLEGVLFLLCGLLFWIFFLLTIREVILGGGTLFVCFLCVFSLRVLQFCSFFFRPAQPPPPTAPTNRWAAYLNGFVKMPCVQAHKNGKGKKKGERGTKHHGRIKCVAVSKAVCLEFAARARRNYHGNPAPVLVRLPTQTPWRC